MSSAQDEVQELARVSSSHGAENLLSGFTPDELAAGLDGAQYEFPNAAIREIQRRREEMIPALIRVIEDETRQLQAGDQDVSSAASLALSLLIEFQAETALPSLLASVSLSGEGPYDLYGDLVTEMFCRTVPSLGSNQLDLVLATIRDRNVDEFVRSVLITGISLLYDAQRRTRAEVLEILEALLRDAIASADEELVGSIAWEIQELNGVELLDLVLEAFAANLIAPDFFGEVDHYVARLHNHPWSAREWTVTDTVGEMLPWYEYDEPGDDFDAGKRDREDEPFDPLLGSAKPSDTIRNDQRHIGRNEPCPCRSGKKYKKCCGKAGSLLDL